MDSGKEKGCLIFTDKLGRGKLVNLVDFDIVREYDVLCSDPFEIREVTVSGEVKEVAPHSFSGCYKLTTVQLPDSIQKIGKAAFSGCSSLKSINIPKNIRYIGESAFKWCDKLTGVILLNNVEIGEGAFKDTKLQIISVNGSIHTSKEFASEEIFIKFIEKMGKNLFECNPFLNYLDVIVDDVENINWDSLFNRVTEEQKHSLCFVYKDVQDLEAKLKFFIKSKNVFLRKNFYFFHRGKVRRNWNDNKLLFVLHGPKLTEEQKNIIRKLLESNNIHFTFESALNKNDFLKIGVVKKLDEESQNLINKINNLLDNTSDDVKNVLSNRINLLIDQYWIDVEKEKPDLDEKNEIKLSFENNEIGSAKVKLNIALNNIVFSLSNQMNLLDLLSELEDYKEIMDSEIKQKPENKDTIEAILQNIAYLTTKVDDEYKKEIVDKVMSYLNEPRIIYEKELEKKFNSVGTELGVLEKLDPRQQLHLNLSNYLDKIEVDAEKVMPYVSLLNCLKNEETVTEFRDDDTLESLIKNVEYVILQFDVEDEKEQLKIKFDSLKEKYIKEIEKVVSNKNGSDKHYNELEIRFRKDLQPFLEDINKYSIKETNQKDLLNDLSISLKLLNKEEISEYKESVISSFVTDILGIINENNLSSEEQDKYIVKIQLLINECLKNLEILTDRNNIREIEEKLYRDLAGIKIQITSYIEKKNQYYKEYGTSIEVDNKIKR